MLLLMMMGSKVDPYLSAGKSIAPSTKALSEMGVTTTATTTSATVQVPPIDPSVIATATSLKDAVTMSPTEPTTTATNAFVIDASHIHRYVDNVLPGFTPTGGILSSQQTNMNLFMDPSTTTTTTTSTTPSVISFVVTIDWASKFINVIDALAPAVFWYALLEFFILRPNLDTYREEIEDDPTGIVTDTIVVTTVRLGIFCLIAMVTVGIMG
jgi:hypothetical protein